MMIWLCACFYYSLPYSSLAIGLLMWTPYGKDDQLLKVKSAWNICHFEQHETKATFQIDKFLSTGIYANVTHLCSRYIHREYIFFLQNVLVILSFFKLFLMCCHSSGQKCSILFIIIPNEHDVNVMLWNFTVDKKTVCISVQNTLVVYIFWLCWYLYQRESTGLSEEIQ